MDSYSPLPATASSVLPRNANEFIQQQLDERIRSIESAFAAHAISFSGPILGGVDDVIRTAIEQRHSDGSPRKKLVVILTTGGGYIEVVQRIVATFRRHYALVDFVIPNYAFSAGTVLAMSGDAIHMDYYSRLGPIDPQVENLRGRQVPALGYLEKYKELIKKAQTPGAITMPEVQILLAFDQAELHQYEQAQELSVALLKEWLVNYKFKNWRQTETRGLKVNKQMKVQRAEAIARDLNDTKKWHVHGHGISMEVLTKDLKLLIDDFGTNAELSAIIRGYNELLTDFMRKLGMKGLVHVTDSFSPYM
jgi:membrane-bound ClpP family serine protease